MVFLSRSSPAVKQCAIFLPRRKLKKEAAHHGNCVSSTQHGFHIAPLSNFVVPAKAGTRDPPAVTGPTS
jgi:hypothetical protein